MTATREHISRWFDTGVSTGRRWMVVLYDSFDWSDYPMYFDTEDEARRHMKHPPSMAKVMECYDLHADKDAQMNQRRAMALTV